MITRCKYGITKPRQMFGGLTKLTHLSDYSQYEPPNFYEEVKHLEWQKAMKTKFSALQLNDTWVLVPPSPKQHLVDIKWV